MAKYRIIYEKNREPYAYSAERWDADGYWAFIHGAMADSPESVEKIILDLHGKKQFEVIKEVELL